MVKYLRIAAKNIARHKRRTILVVVMIGSGVAMSILLEGILEDMRLGWLKAIIHTQTGHLQIMPEGYLKRELMSPLDLLISSPMRLKEFIEKEEGVVSLTERLNFSGMIATQEKTTIFNGIGVDPINEYEVFSLLKGVERGSPILRDKPYGGVIGTRLAENLGIDIGGVVTLVSNTKYGTLNAINMEVVGIFSSGVPEVDSMCLYLPLEGAFKLLDIEGEVSSIVCILEDIRSVPKFKERVKRFIETEYGFEGLEVHSWDELATLYKRVMGMQGFTIKMIELIIFFLIALAISSIMLMSVFERTREIGTMTAFGIKRSQIMTLFLTEAFLIGILGGMIGILVGSSITAGVFFVGIPYIPPGTEKVVYMRPLLCVDKMVFVFLIGIVSTLIGGLYPSWWAARIRPIDALRFV